MATDYVVLRTPNHNGNSMWEIIKFTSSLKRALAVAQNPKVPTFAGDILVAVHIDWISDIEEHADHKSMFIAIADGDVRDVIYKSISSGHKSWLGLWAHGSSINKLGAAQFTSPNRQLSACVDCFRSILSPESLGNPNHIFARAIKIVEASASSGLYGRRSVAMAKFVDEVTEEYVRAIMHTYYERMLSAVLKMCDGEFHPALYRMVDAEYYLRGGESRSEIEAQFSHIIDQHISLPMVLMSHHNVIV